MNLKSCFSTLVSWFRSILNLIQNWYVNIFTSNADYNLLKDTQQETRIDEQLLYDQLLSDNENKFPPSAPPSELKEDTINIDNKNINSIQAQQKLITYFNEQKDQSIETNQNLFIIEQERLFHHFHTDKNI